MLVTNISPLTPNQQIRRHFGTHGTIQSFEPQIDRENGSALGIILIRFSTHDEAKLCVEKENGKRLGVGGPMGLSVGTVEGEEIRVIFDGEGAKMRAVMKELDEGRRRIRDEKKRKEKEAKVKEANAAASTPPTMSAGQTPTQQPAPRWPPGSNQQRPISTQFPNGRPAHLPQHPGTHYAQQPNGITPHSINGNQNTSSGVLPGRVRRPPPSLMQARMSNPSGMSSAFHTKRHPLPPNPLVHSSSSAPIRIQPFPGQLSRLNPHSQPSPLNVHSRSPSPISRRPGQSNQSAKQKEHEAVNEALVKNGFDHAKIDGNALGGSVTEEDVRDFFSGFEIDKILQDHLGWYVTFQTGGAARRAAMVLNSGARTLARHTVTISARPAPSKSTLTASSSGNVRWEEEELVDAAEQAIAKELKGLLEKDVMERVVGPDLRKVIADEKVKRVEAKSRPTGKDEVVDSKFEKPGLKGLSFKKPNKRIREEVKKPTLEMEMEAEAETVVQDGEEVTDAAEVVERPKKRRKKDVPSKKTRKLAEEDVESEDDDTLVTESGEVTRKRSTSEDRDDDEPTRKKVKAVHADDVTIDIRKKAQPKKKLSKKLSRPAIEDVVEDIVFTPSATPDLIIHDALSLHSSLSRTPSPAPISKESRLPTPPPDPLEHGLCEDDEDLYFSRLALFNSPVIDEEGPTTSSAPEADIVPPFRIHVTGSARTEGVYKISHAEKSAYVAQYALRATATEEAAPVEAALPQHITSSRSNRATARRRALGLEEINQVQRAVALSKGEDGAAEMTVKFNQLQTRKKHLRFARSPIHDWGLYAMERISRGEMVIEYVGEVIRAQVADKREKAYERQGIGSSYLFRIDEDLVVDATKKGNLGYVFSELRYVVTINLDLQTPYQPCL